MQNAKQNLFAAAKCESPNWGKPNKHRTNTRSIETAQAGIEALSWKVGLVLLVLGTMHFFNLFLFNRIHRRPKFFNRPQTAPSVVQ